MNKKDKGESSCVLRVAGCGFRNGNTVNPRDRSLFVHFANPGILDDCKAPFVASNKTIEVAN
ncbi:MAG: hypothetical protein NUV74_10355 [Candidatus Brocadiaceae bacterium]|nr:hypothetical protein [Candidatus Brocadiaceae bacterium]